MKKGIEPLLEKREIRLDEITGHGCAWIGCKSEYLSNTLPPGWRLLVVAKGSLFDKRNLLNADIDGSLCPQHVDELGKLLKTGFKLSIAASEVNRSGN